MVDSGQIFNATRHLFAIPGRRLLVLEASSLSAFHSSTMESNKSGYCCEVVFAGMNLR